jgi:hypothetical protein
MTSEYRELRGNPSLPGRSSQAPTTEAGPEGSGADASAPTMDRGESRARLLSHISRSRVALAGVALTIFAISCLR